MFCAFSALPHLQWKFIVIELPVTFLSFGCLYLRVLVHAGFGYKHQEFPASRFNSRISAIYRIIIRFSFASVYLSSCLISPSLIHLPPILINSMRLKFQATVSGSFSGQKLHLKSWFHAKNFWSAAMSSEESRSLWLAMKWPLGVLTLWSFIVVNGAWKFPEAIKNWLLVCLISLPELYISITRWAPPVSMWLPYFFGLKWQTEIDLQTQPVRRQSVCAPFLQTKQPCSPNKSLRWFGNHLSSIKVVAL